MRRLPEGLKVPLRKVEAGWAKVSPGDAKGTWARSEPSPELTWGVELSGRPFWEKAVEYGAGGRILEVGPGYGRLVRAASGFESWTGIDISPANIEHLRREFPQHEWILGDVESVRRPCDTILSSLTFKHFAPSFEKALQNLCNGFSGLVVIDLMEGRGLRRYQEDGSFLRWYTREEVSEIFSRCGLSVEFDYVDHDSEHRRLLAIGTSRQTL